MDSVLRNNFSNNSGEIVLEYEDKLKDLRKEIKRMHSLLVDLLTDISLKRDFLSGVEKSLRFKESKYQESLKDKSAAGEEISSKIKSEIDDLKRELETGEKEASLLEKVYRAKLSSFYKITTEERSLEKERDLRKAELAN